jgi:hypothetical protein
VNISAFEKVNKELEHPTTVFSKSCIVNTKPDALTTPMFDASMDFQMPIFELPKRFFSFGYS